MATSLNEKLTLTPVLKFELPSLPYAYDALEPFIDKLTMQIHHDKHHGTYVSNLNKALEECKERPASLKEIIQNISAYPTAIRNNAGGHFNHSFFWKSMKPKNGEQPLVKLSEAINHSFGSFNTFKSMFTEAATKHFGSGWTWLVIRNNKLEIGSTPNQDNPLMDVSDFKGIPILGLDIWEHAYYLKYQNKRIDYINAWWDIVNWDEVTNNFQRAN